jgi:hypothetical protein
MYTPMEIKVKDLYKREMFNQLKEHKTSIQVLKDAATIQRVVEEHS